MDLTQFSVEKSYPIIRDFPLIAAKKTKINLLTPSYPIHKQMKLLCGHRMNMIGGYIH